MSGILQTDTIIKNCIEAGLEDLRLNPWVIDHIFSSLKDQSQIAAAKAFFLNNSFPVLMSNRVDSPPGFFISVTLGSSKEDRSQAWLGDMSNETITYSPSQINKPIPYIIKPFNIVSYDPATGIITIPDTILEYKYISAGMLSVDPATGNACNILESLGNSRYAVALNSVISNKQAIIPAYPMYKARLEGGTFIEDYQIGVHCSGDPFHTINLHSIVLYTMLRYRESLLEAEGFQISTVSSSEMVKSSQHESIGESFFSRYITLSGQIQNFWVKAPQRYIESIDFNDSSNALNPAGIKIISSDRLPGADDGNDMWTTVSDSDDLTPDNDDDDPFWNT